MLSVVNADGSTSNGSLIDEIVREGARRMFAAALEAEVNAHIAELTDQRDDRGRRLVIRNGYHQPRSVTTAAGPVDVKGPRVNDRRIDESTGERKRFSSAILPPWCRKSPKISEVLPCSTCTVCPPATSCPHSSSSGAARPVSRRPPSPASPSSDRPTTRHSANATWPDPTTSTSGPTASICASAWPK